MNAALTASGVSGGDVLRCPMLALAIARYGINFHFTSGQQESLAKHVRAGGCMHLPRAEDAEGLLVKGRGPPGDPSLPLARSLSSG